MKKFGKYVYTSDTIFAIEGKDSDFLYIQNKAVEVLRKDSPLKRLIEQNILDITEMNVSLDKKDGLDNTKEVSLADEYGNPIIYNKYKFKRTLIQSSDPDINENDCLEFSEYLTSRVVHQLNEIDNSLKLLPYRYDAIVLQSKDLPTILPKSIQCFDNDLNVISNDNINKFGDCDEKNEYITKLVNVDHKNEKANPNEGETYAIVTIDSLTEEEEHDLIKSREEIISSEEDTGSNKIPYHIATVIYKSGDINITLEAAEDPSITEKQPQFSFYTIKNTMNNFHNHRKKLYDKYNKERNGRELLMNTIVLMPRNKDILLNEIYDSHEYKKQPKVLSSRKRIREHDDDIHVRPSKIAGGKSKKTQKMQKNVKNTPKNERQSKTKTKTKRKRKK